MKICLSSLVLFLFHFKPIRTHGHWRCSISLQVILENLFNTLYFQELKIGYFNGRNKEYVWKRSLKPDGRKTLKYFTLFSICSKILYLFLFCFIFPTVKSTNYPLLMVDKVPVPKLKTPLNFLVVIFMKL